MNGQSSDAKEKACGFAKELLQCQCAYFFHFLTDLFKILTRMSLEFQKNDNSAENVTRKLQVTLDGLRSLSTTPGPIERVFMEQMSKRIKGIASCSAENIWKVFRLQKCAARVILGADTKPNSVKLFKQLGWVPFYHEARINKLILVCKRIFGECPPYLTPMLLRNVNGRSRRHGHLNLICPRFKRETEGGRSFSVSTSRLWNMLPTHIKNQSTLTSFKKSIFKHFMDSYKEMDHFII